MTAAEPGAPVARDRLRPVPEPNRQPPHNLEAEEAVLASGRLLTDVGWAGRGGRLLPGCASGDLVSGGLQFLPTWVIASFALVELVFDPRCPTHRRGEERGATDRSWDRSRLAARQREQSGTGYAAPPGPSWGRETAVNNGQSRCPTDN
jgi:hypothetical protein